MNARFEIAIAGKHGCRDQIEFADRLFDLRMERPGVSDASRAPISDDVESELIEVRLQSGFLKVIGDDPGPRRE